MNPSRPGNSTTLGDFPASPDSAVVAGRPVEVEEFTVLPFSDAVIRFFRMTDKERTSTPPSPAPERREEPVPVVRQPAREEEAFKSWIGDSAPATGSREQSVMERRPIPSDPPPDESKE